MDTLRKILEVKKAEVGRLRGQAEALRERALMRNDFRPFGLALRRGEGELGLIAEVKKASPSAGVIREDFDPVEMARAYQSAGAHAVSVLTDREFFQGDLSHLTGIRREVDLPLLRKDFIIDRIQLYEAVAAGADAVLLIVAALDVARLVDLLQEAEGLQLDVLVEAHTLDEVEQAIDIGAGVVGINNRNLKTFEVDLGATERLSEEIPDEVVLVSESGILGAEHTRRLIDCGVDAILVGETLMRADDIDACVDALLHPPKSARARVVE